MDLPLSVTIRLAEAADVPALMAIEVAAVELFRGHPAYAPFAATATTAVGYAEVIAAGRVYVAVVEGEVVGLVTVAELDGEGYLEEVDVHPTHGRRGIGAALVAHACGWAKARGYGSMVLVTLRDVPWNAPFYAHHGFVAVAPDTLSPGLQAILAHEAERGFPMALRAVMRRMLQGSPFLRGE